MLIRNFNNINESNYQTSSISSPNSLKKYQSFAINKIINNFKLNINSLCNYSVGTGKTMITCEIIKEFLLQKNNGYILILCPSNEIRDGVWSKHLTEYNITHKVLVSSVLSNLKNQRKRSFTPINNIDVYIMTYSLFTKKDTISNSFNSDFFATTPPLLIILDEVHRLSNNAIKIKDGKKIITKTTTKHILKLNAKFKLGLTGTELVNKIDEKDVLFKILNPNLKKTYKTFNTFIISYQKEKSNSNSFLIFYEPTSEQQKIFNEYKTTQNYAFTKIAEKELLTYKQIKGKAIKEIPIENLLKNISKDDKIIILAKDIKYLKLISRFECINKERPLLIHGTNMSISERRIKLNNFIEDPKSRILLATKQLASEGLNLQIANHIIICGLSWTPKEIIQAIGRINRLNQKKTTFAYILTEISTIPRLYDSKNNSWTDFKKLYLDLESPTDYFPDYVNYFIKPFINKDNIYQKEHQAIFNPDVIMVDNEELNWIFSNIITIGHLRKNSSNITTKKINKDIETFLANYFLIKNDFSILNTINETVTTLSSNKTYINDSNMFILYRISEIIKSWFICLHLLNIIKHYNYIQNKTPPFDNFMEFIQSMVHNIEITMDIYESEELVNNYKTIIGIWRSYIYSISSTISNQELKSLIYKSIKEYKNQKNKLLNLMDSNTLNKNIDTEALLTDEKYLLNEVISLDKTSVSLHSLLDSLEY